MKRLSDIDFTKTYGDVPESFQHRVQYALRQTEEAQPVKRFTLRTVIIAAVLTILLGTVAYAAITSSTVDWFSQFYGEDWKNAVLQGDIAPSGQSIQLGDVVYTLNDVVITGIDLGYADKEGNPSQEGMVIHDDTCSYILATGTIRPAEGANIVLIPEDYPLTYPYGGLESHPFIDPMQKPPAFPEGTVSMLDKAVEQNAVIRLATVIGNSLIDANGEAIPCEIGYNCVPQEDGSMVFALEIIPEKEADEGGYWIPANMAKMEEYTLSLYLANWEVTREGEHLRDEGNDTRVWQDWVITVKPEIKAQ